MDEPPGARVSTLSLRTYGKVIRTLRSLTNSTVNKEPKWRHPGPELTTGYQSNQQQPSAHQQQLSATSASRQQPSAN
jgi:hypothetical protein